MSEPASIAWDDHVAMLSAQKHRTEKAEAEAADWKAKAERLRKAKESFKATCGAIQADKMTVERQRDAWKSKADQYEDALEHIRAGTMDPEGWADLALKGEAGNWKARAEKAESRWPCPASLKGWRECGVLTHRDENHVGYCGLSKGPCVLSLLEGACGESDNWKSRALRAEGMWEKLRRERDSIPYDSEPRVWLTEAMREIEHSENTEEVKG